MRVAALQELLDSDEPVLVEQKGRISGVYVPLAGTGRFSGDLRRDLIDVLGTHLSASLDKKGIPEEEIQKDFSAYRRSRR